MIASAANATFDAAFEKIRQRFLGRLETTIPALEAFYDELANASFSYDRLRDIFMQVHKLAGSAKTFGFEDVSIAAAALEHQLDFLQEGYVFEGITPPLQDAYEGLLLELKQARLLSAMTTMIAEETLPPPSSNPRYHLLIADDDDLVRDLLRQGLHDAGCRISTANNGAQALEMLSPLHAQFVGNLPDLVILDVNMPEMTGFDVLHVLKQQAHTKEIPVLMLTRRDEDENIIKGINGGALDYIAKPFAVPVLLTRIMNTLERHSMKILIADDDELIREVLQQRFQRMGYTVLLAAEGIGALNILAQEKPAACVLDIMMPGMDGISVLRHAKSQPETAVVPIILLSAKNQQENILQGLESGAHDYITKSFDVEEVAARVAGILYRQKAFA